VKEYYTYAYLREDGTPYYIGKGKGDRIKDKRRSVSIPPDDRVIFLKKNLTEEEAFRHEIYIIAVLGRKDLGTGILRNLSNGGDGASGAVRSEETRKKIGDAHRGKKRPPLPKEQKEKISKSLKGRPKKPFSKEHLEKMRKSHLGKKDTPETKEKKRQAHLGQKRTPEQRERIRQAALKREAKRRMNS